MTTPLVELIPIALIPIILVFIFLVIDLLKPFSTKKTDDDFYASLLDKKKKSEQQPQQPQPKPKKSSTPTFECPKCGGPRRKTPCEYCGTQIT